MDFIGTRFYTDTLTDVDRSALRQSVLTAAKKMILEPESIKRSRRIVASKLSAALANFALRDFPQSWDNTFAKKRKTC